MNTRGLIIFAMLLCLAATTYAANLNSKVLDEIEYYIQTDKVVYQLGENVEMWYRITNYSSQNVTFILPQSEVWNFWVEKDGGQIWQGWYSGLAVETQFTLTPGQSRLCPEWGSSFIWNLKNTNGNLVGIGNYDVIGGLYDVSGYYDYTKVSVPIEIVPEPATILLLGIGIILAQKKRI